jgi:hypothetical protein
MKRTRREDRRMPPLIWKLCNFAYTKEGNNEKACIATHKYDPEWILDSGASKHVTNLNVMINILSLRLKPYKLLMAHHNPSKV